MAPLQLPKLGTGKLYEFGVEPPGGMWNIIGSSTGICEERVAVLQQPSADWICSLLGIRHAGGTYIPLDMLSPLERLTTIVSAAKPRAILIHGETVEDIARLQSNAAFNQRH